MRAPTGIEPRGVRIGLRAASFAVMVFLYIPLFVIVLYAFNESRGQAWPIKGYTLKWFHVAWQNDQVRGALTNSVKAGIGATIIALVLGTLASFALHNFRFFGRESVSFLLVLPLALPGIVTGMALNSAINFGGLTFSLWTIIIGHATFCIVIVFNNVIARLRRTPSSLAEASADLGASGWQTLRYVLFPALRTALVAGALLAFALSFDEIIVTNFTSGTEITLPKWIFNNLRLPNLRPQVNVVAFVVILASFLPVYLAQRLAGGSEGARLAPAAQRTGS